MDRREFLAATTSATALLFTGSASTAELAAAPWTGAVPDTLDLADRARLSINALTGSADPARNFETYVCCHLHAKPAYLSMRSGGPCLPKPVHALAMMRAMSGSEQNPDVDARMMDAVVSTIEADGLWWLKADGRPWDGEVYGEDTVCVGQQARLIVALLDWHRYTGDLRWLDTAGRLVAGLSRLARISEDRAWFFYFWTRSGWKEDKSGSIDAKVDPRKPSDREPGTPDIYANGLPLRALARWYAATGDQAALGLAEKVARFMLKAFSSSQGEMPDWPTMVAGREQGFFAGHFHSWTMGMIGMAEYAVVTNDPHAKRIAKGFYEFARVQGIGRIGFFPAAVMPLNTLRQNVTAGYGEFPGQACEACGIADMTRLAVTLSEAGIGDYWEDVDQYVRNHMVEHQWLRADYMQAISDASPEHKVDPRMQTDGRVIERMVGAFGSVSDPTWLYGWFTQCCNANIPMGLYRAWEAIATPNGDGVQVNLLLNRFSPWVDVESHLPYEGKAVLRVGSAKWAHVRIPAWADKSAVRCRVDGMEQPLRWLGNYLLFDGLRSGTEVVLEWPMVESVEKHSEKSYGIEYTIRFRGNTVVDISPRGDKPGRTVDIADDGAKFKVAKGYPMYERDALTKTVAPTRQVHRFVAPRLIDVTAQLRTPLKRPSQ